MAATGFRRLLFLAGTSHGLQANNLTDDLQARGLTSVNSIRSIYDVNGVVGGPILRSKLWFTIGTSPERPQSADRQPLLRREPVGLGVHA